MLTIKHFEATETISFEELFNQLGFSSKTLPTDDSGDSFITDEWGVEVLSADAYYPIEGYRWTKPENQVKLVHQSLSEIDSKYLQCSPDHIVMRFEPNPGWTKVGNLQVDDLIICQGGSRRVTQIENINEFERLCDLQVAIAHSFFAEGVLSHNSHFLIQMGSSAIKAGKNVLHYTFELSEALVGTRYDSHLCDTAFNDVMDRKADIIEKYKNMKIGKLIIKEFPMNTCTVQTIRAHIERLSLKGFVPDLIVIDYADIMRSSRQFDSLRHELKLIYEELRSYATELQLPIWTASQTNRDASQSDVVGLESMAEAYGKAMVADVVITISRKSMEKSLGYGRLFVAKNRAGRDGLVYPLKIDTSKSMFSITGEVSTPQEEIQQNEASYKQRIKEKFRECELDKLQEKQAENKVVGD